MMNQINNKANNNKPDNKVGKKIITRNQVIS